MASVGSCLQNVAIPIVFGLLGLFFGIASWVAPSSRLVQSVVGKNLKWGLAEANIWVARFLGPPIGLLSIAFAVLGPHC